MDATAHFEHLQAIKCDFKPGSVSRSSIDLDKEGMPRLLVVISITATNKK
jgi:hypothetical protein